MDEGSAAIREYRDSDYLDCENLVSNAWGFDKNLAPQELADLSKYLYTMGSIAASNFLMVLENNNKVVGFLFGLNENLPVPKHDLNKLTSKLVLLKKLLFIKGMGFTDRMEILKSMNTHELNRTKLIGRGKSEIVLFVVDPEYQGFGYGKKLLAEFISYCRESDVNSIVVGTNKSGASSFYESVGFTHRGDFYSPLHKYVSKNGQACMYEYVL